MNNYLLEYFYTNDIIILIFKGKIKDIIIRIYYRGEEKYIINYINIILIFFFNGNYVGNNIYVYK